MYNVPLSAPSLQGNEWQYVKECLDEEWVSSAGKYVDLFEQKIAEYTGSKYAVACVNGTSALHLSLKLVGVEPGDEVITPTLTFIAPVNAIAYNRANPVFMDADKYYNLDQEKTIDFIKKGTVFKDGFTRNKKTGNRISAIVPVHVWGNAACLDELVPLCVERNIPIVEDASESLGTFYSTGKFKGRHTGTIGKLGCLSFNGNKIITTGGGGMILTDSEELGEKTRYLTTQAKDDKIQYIHNEIGYNYRLTNIQAALGVAQMEQLLKFLQRKKEIHMQYLSKIKNIAGLKLTKTPDYANSNYWLNILQIDEKIFGEDRKILMARLENKGIQTRPLWHLNHLQKPYQNSFFFNIDNALKLLDKSLCLPSSTNLNNRDLDFITELIKKKNDR